MARHTQRFAEEQAKCTIKVNGKTYTHAEWVAMHKSQNPHPVRKKRDSASTAYIRSIAPSIKDMVKKVKVIKSLASYYTNGHRQWGHICSDNIIGHPFISAPFSLFVSSTKDIDDQLQKVMDLCHHNDTDVFQFIEGLGEKVAIMMKRLDALYNGVHESRVCEFYKDSEAINGRGRRLGLEELMHRAGGAGIELSKIAMELDKLGKTGFDNIEYDPYTLRRIN